MCINARADPNSTHVPFRDSKLTRLLQVSAATSHLLIIVFFAVRQMCRTLHLSCHKVLWETNIVQNGRIWVYKSVSVSDGFAHVLKVPPVAVCTLQQSAVTGSSVRKPFVQAE